MAGYVVMMLLMMMQLASSEPELDTKEDPIIRQPPSITGEMEKEIIYQPSSEVLIPCVASGDPEPEYEWKKDGGEMEDHLGITVSKGVLRIKQAFYSHAGEYQCFASNTWGTALSDIVELKLATMFMDTSQDVEQIQVLHGDPTTMRCGAVKSVPQASFSWWISESQLDDDMEELPLNSRTVQDEDGSLHFSYVLPGDSRGGNIYRCRSYNSRLDSLQGGSYKKIDVIPNSPQEKIPTIMYSSMSRVTEPYMTALVGRELVLKCAFAGYPSITYSWNFNGAPAPSHLLQVEHKSTLVLKSVRMSDEGRYTCNGVNKAGKGQEDIPVKVFEAPNFNVDDEKPHDTTVTEGEDAHFYCRAAGKPKPTIQWMKNGVDLPEPAPGTKIMFDGDDRSHLIIVHVCKECDSGGDLMTIQCRADNDHGYAFAGGFLNVILRTEIITEPEDVLLESYEDYAEFSCEATTDDGTLDQLTYSWKFKNEWLILHYDPDDSSRRITRDKAIYTTEHGKHLYVDTEHKEIGDYEGVYTCVADNGHSSDERNASLTLPAGPRPAVTEGGIGDIWWIFIIIALILLLLILLLCCCLCMQRNKGDTYPIDEKERAQGNDPEKELADSGFHDYQRPEDGPMKGSRASLSSTIKLDSDDDEASLAEYGDIDTGKFNEDGSFIGQYATDRKKRPPTESSI